MKQCAAIDSRPPQVTIYALVDPRQPRVVRYIGQSKVPRIRHIQHCEDCHPGLKSEWIESLRQIGIMPQMIILERCSIGQANMAEKRWIRRMKFDGLCNVSGASCIGGPLVEKEAFLDQLFSGSESNPTCSLKEVERIAIGLAMRLHAGNKLEVSRFLKIGRQTLYNKLKEYDIDSNGDHIGDDLQPHEPTSNQSTRPLSSPSLAKEMNHLESVV